MKPTRVLPPGEVLPPAVTPDAGKRASTRPAGRKGKAKPAKRSRRHSGRWGVLNAFVDMTAGTLPRAALAVWLVLFRDTRNGVARTGVASLAKRVGCDRRNVLRSLRLLVDRGLVDVVHRGGKWRGCSTYKVTPVSPCHGDISMPQTVAPTSPLSRKNHAAGATPARTRRKKAVAAGRQGV